MPVFNAMDTICFSAGFKIIAAVALESSANTV
jgi:hypothetical protein